jgi:hypothetical protein
METVVINVKSSFRTGICGATCAYHDTVLGVIRPGTQLARNLKGLAYEGRYEEWISKVKHRQRCEQLGHMLVN